MMLSGTLLDGAQREQLKGIAASDLAMPRPGATLQHASSGLRRYAALRAGRAAQGPAANAAAEGDHKAVFNEASAAVAEAASHVTQDIPDEVVAAVSDLFEPGSATTAAVRTYWVELGFSPAEVDAYLAEAVAARAGLPDIARLVQTVADWSAALGHFAASHPDHRYWGFGFAGDGALDENARAFVTASRRAGVTPSLYLMVTILLLLDKVAEELAEV